MDRKPESIELEIADQRRKIEDKVRGIRGRVDTDVATLSTEARERANLALDEVGRFVESPMREHPYTTMAAGFGVGACLGAVTGGLPIGGSSRHETHEGRTSASQDGGVAGFLGSLVGFSADTLQDEVRDFIRQAISEVFSNKRGKGYDPV